MRKTKVINLCKTNTYFRIRQSAFSYFETQESFGIFVFPTQPFETKMTTTSDYLWGIDLGGTKIECVVVRASTHDIVHRQRLPTEAHLGYSHILNQIKTLLSDVAQQLDCSPNAVGFSTPGTLDPSTQTMKNCNTTAMNGQPMHRDLEALLGVPIALANDANCFVLAETHQGAVAQLAPDAQVVFGVILGTGVGGGLVINGQLIHGKHGIGGEWGHILFDPAGDPCYCGKNGCNEMVFSGPKLEKKYAQLSGQSLRLPAIYARHKEGIDPFATQTIQFLTTSFGRAISGIINVLDPDVVVIGGGVGQIEELYTDGVEELKKYIFNSGIVQTKFLKPQLGDSAGVFGAIELVRGLTK